MYYFVSYTFVSVLVLVQSQESFHTQGSDPHNYTVLERCDPLEINLKDPVVMPRERHVVLKPIPGYEFIPRTVSVPRCSGSCMEGTPMPTHTEIKSFIVLLHRKGSSMPLECVSVQVHAHTNCRCECKGSESDCTYKQFWNRGECSCRCYNDEPRTCPTDMVWNEELCLCVSPRYGQRY